MNHPDPEVLAGTERSRPLCVVRTGGLLRNSIVVEAAFALLKARPSLLLRLPAWMAQGPDTLGREVAERVAPDPRYLPYDRMTLGKLAEARSTGRRTVLVAAGEAPFARTIADHLGLFDEIVEARSRGKADQALAARFGEGGFEWLRDKGGTDGPQPEHGDSPGGPSRSGAPAWRLILRAIRAHQWLKNILIFLPVVAGQQLLDPGVVLRASLALVAFSLAASSVYVVNDLLDLAEDRKHPSKRLRPFASGDLPLSLAPILLVSMVGTAVLLAFTLPVEFAGSLATYLALSLAYSLKLKGAVLLDVLTLAGLYSLRVIAGCAATGITPSVWLLGLSLFFFLSLALVKRYAELHVRVSRADDLDEGRLPGRSYRAGDLPVLISLGVASGCISVLVLALYLISDEFARHYRYPVFLWLLCPLTLYWMGRVWIVVSRDEMEDDPLIWAVKDQLSRWVGVIALALLILAK